jgi:hypothetical protein
MTNDPIECDGNLMGSVGKGNNYPNECDDIRWGLIGLLENGK